MAGKNIKAKEYGGGDEGLPVNGPILTVRKEMHEDSGDFTAATDP